MKPLADRIKSLYNEITAMEHAARRYGELEESLKVMNRQWRDMDARLDKELKDIERLEKMSIQSLFHEVLGSKEEQLEKERQEYLALNLKYKELNKSIQITEYEMSVLKNKISGTEALRAELNKLIKERETEILTNGEPSRDRLLQFITKEQELIRMQTEIQEAIVAGKAAINGVLRVLSYLKKAENWGQWDMYGKGHYYDHMKHTAIDQAVDEAYRTRHLLTVLRNELADVGYHEEQLRLNVESFSKFTDVFFDNLISDWIIQRKIKNVIASVSGVHDKTVLIVQMLTADAEKNQNALENLQSERQNFLIQ